MLATHALTRAMSLSQREEPIKQTSDANGVGRKSPAQLEPNDIKGGNQPCLHR